jgi:hypothetical protein
VLVWKGSSTFLDQIEERVRRAYHVVQVPGNGFYTTADAELPELAHLTGAVVILDIPGGAIDSYQNVIAFARALKPSRLVAFHGADCEFVALDEFEPLTGRKTASLGRPATGTSPRVEPDEPAEDGKPAVFWMRKVEPAAAIPQGDQR